MPHEEEIWGWDKEACLDTAAPPSRRANSETAALLWVGARFCFSLDVIMYMFVFPVFFGGGYSSPSCWLFKTFCRDDEQSNWERFFFSFFFLLTCSLCCSPQVSWARPPRPIAGCQSCDWCASSRPCHPSPSSAPEHSELPELGYFKMRYYKKRADKIFFIYPTNMCAVKYKV